jgi:hypothetical protein
MSLAIEWTYSAEAALKRIHWRTASDVAGAVRRFAEDRAPALRGGRYTLRSSFATRPVEAGCELGTFPGHSRASRRPRGRPAQATAKSV